MNFCIVRTCIQNRSCETLHYILYFLYQILYIHLFTIQTRISMAELQLEINELHFLFLNLSPLPAFSLPSDPYLQPFFFIELYKLWVWSVWVCDVLIYSGGIFIINFVKLTLKITKKISRQKQVPVIISREIWIPCTLDRNVHWGGHLAKTSVSFSNN